MTQIKFITGAKEDIPAKYLDQFLSLFQVNYAEILKQEPPAVGLYKNMWKLGDSSDQKRVYTVVLNQDEDYIEDLKKVYTGRVLTVGTTSIADIWVKQITFYPFENKMSFIVVIDGQEHLISMTLLGERMVINVLMAITVALQSGITIEEIISSLSSFKSISGRMAIEKFMDLNIIDDSYNANPESMRSSLITLKKCDNQFVFVLQ